MTPRPGPRPAYVVVLLLALLTGVVSALLLAGRASAADRSQTLTSGKTISVRSGDGCLLQPAAPSSGRDLLRNIVCAVDPTPSVPPAPPPAPLVQVLSGGDTLAIRSGDGCTLKPADPTTGRKWVRNFVCVGDAPPPPSIGGGSSAAGTAIGFAQYAVPAGAIVVSPTGNDAAAGTTAAPLKTLGRAVVKAVSGATIVLRAGTYHESVVIPSDKRLTVQAWPSEAVWMDGSSAVTGWVASGSRWRRDGWTVEFDASPTYTRGAPDNTAPSWRFVNPSYPMAAHPDQIWIDGVAQLQVGSLGAVVAGTFFHDQGANQLWLGTNPTGKSVRASDLVQALAVRSTSSALKGFGIRRYAPSVPDMGAVTIERPKVLVENVAITDASTTGLHVGSGTTADVVLRNLYVARNGMLGINASQADNLTLDKVLSEGNNTERFNQSPVSGGAKIGRTRKVLVRDSVFRSNSGPGLWMDESVYDMTIVGNEMRSNAGHGTSLEISAKAVFANNFVTNNGGFGIKINNTANVTLWNNTFVGNDRSINLVQDARRPTSASTEGRDKRQPFPDSTMTWLNGPAVFMNNVVANQRSGNCMLCVEDYSQQRSAAKIGVTSNSNIYNRPSSAANAVFVVWSGGPGDPYAYTLLATFQSASGQEASGQLINGGAVVDSNGSAISAMSNTAQPLPAAIAAMTGKPTGTRYQGAWTR